MTELIALAEPPLLWLALYLLLGWLFAGILPLLLHFLARTAPASRALALFIYALLPPICALAIVLLTLSPLASQFLVPGHCHGDNCSPHSPEFQLAPGLAVTGAGMALIGLCIGTLWLHSKLTRASARLGVLTALGSWQRERAYTRVDSELAFAWCTGLWRARVIVSSALERALTTEQLGAVLAHEHCHAQRRDNLRRVLAQTATRLWPAGGRQRLMATLSLATELACDRFATDCLGQSSALIEALKQLASEPGPGAAQAACHHHYLARCEALQSTDPPQLPLTAYLLLALLWALPVIALPAGLHLLLESF